MASLNKVQIIGNIGNTPDCRTFDNGTMVTNISVATTERWTDKQTGEKRELTEWHRVVFFGKLAEIAGKYLKKGGQVYIEGRLRTRKWTDKDGIDRYTTEITADSMQMLGSPNQAPQAQPQQTQQAPQAQPQAITPDEVSTDEIPF